MRPSSNSRTSVTKSLPSHSASSRSSLIKSSLPLRSSVPHRAPPPPPPPPLSADSLAPFSSPSLVQASSSPVATAATPTTVATPTPATTSTTTRLTPIKPSPSRPAPTRLSPASSASFSSPSGASKTHRPSLTPPTGTRSSDNVSPNHSPQTSSFATATASFRAKILVETTSSPVPATATFSSSVQSGTASSRLKAAPPPPSGSFKCSKCGKSLRVGKICAECVSKSTSAPCALRPASAPSATTTTTAPTTAATSTTPATTTAATITSTTAATTASATTASHTSYDIPGNILVPASSSTTAATSSLTTPTSPDEAVPSEHKFLTLRQTTLPKLALPPKKGQLRPNTLPRPSMSAPPPTDPVVLPPPNTFTASISSMHLGLHGKSDDAGTLVRVAWPAIFGKFSTVRVFASTTAWELNERLAKNILETPDLKVPQEIELSAIYLELQMPNGRFLDPTDCVLDILRPGSITARIYSKSDVTKEETWQSGERMELALAIRLKDKKDFWKAPWSADTGACQCCSGKFSMITRKHHCRRCGSLVCETCSPALGRVAGYDGPVRICKPCLEVSLY